jgi:hypothetical protein
MLLFINMKRLRFLDVSPLQVLRVLVILGLVWQRGAELTELEEQTV